MDIEGVDGLSIDDDGFIWRGTRYRYEDVRSIRFYAARTRHSVNFIPTGSTHHARLVLLMRDDHQVEIVFTIRSFFDQTQQQRGMKGVWQAKEILSTMTFANRVTLFEREFRQRGYFTYASYQFHKDGDIFKNGRRLFSCRDPGFTFATSPFQLHLKPKQKGLAKFISSETIISTEEDEDCLYFMLQHAYGIRWDNQLIRSKERLFIDPRRVFLAAMVKLAAKVAIADGSVSPHELQTFKTHFGITSDSFPEAGRIFNEALNSKETAAEIARAASTAVKDSQEFREYILIGLVKIAMADGNYHDREHQIVVSVASELGFDDDELAHILAICGVFRSDEGKANSRSKESRGQRDTAADLVAFHCRVLGLGREATIFDIKTSWRRLAQQHHPDRLQALGIPASEIKIAEETLKAINASYAWLKSFHKMGDEAN